MIKPTFEESLDIINQEITKRRNKWRLNSIRWMDYEDISQMLRLHIWKKWHLWDAQRPLEPWLNRIISHQLINLIRDNWTNFVRPCLKCSANQGDNLCAMTPSGKQCVECPFYKKWMKTKKPALDVKLPVSIDGNNEPENPIKIQIENKTHEFIDYDKISLKLHARMKKILKPVEFEVYTYLYIEHLSDEDVARKMGYKTSEKDRIPGYKRIQKIKNIILKNAKVICTEITYGNTY